MKIPRLRWIVIALLFLATLINYVDRQTMAVLKGSIAADIGLTNEQYAAVQNTFLLFYGISQMVSGRLYDAIGTRLGFVFSIVLWSVAAMLHATAQGPAGFRIWRAALGFGEAGNWPGAVKAVTEWFPVKERALGVGIFNAGASLGGGIAAPIIAFMAIQYGWRATFVATGAIGLLWVVLWLAIYGPPDRHAWLTESERRYIVSDQDAAPSIDWRPGWRVLLGYRQTWAVVVARFLTDPIWWLYVFWMPSYFQEARGFSLQQIGMFTWFPFFAAGVGCLVGGWASGWLIGRGWSVHRGRMIVMAAGALMMPAGILAVRASSPYVALAFMGVVLFGYQVWMNNVQTLPSDFYPKTAVASVAGLGGTSAAIASILFNWGTGRVVDYAGYTPVFVVAGLLGPAGLLALALLAGRIAPVQGLGSRDLGLATAKPSLLG
jgi:MFS transporter, ACS family, aldohexuronate transporter